MLDSEIHALTCSQDAVLVVLEIGLLYGCCLLALHACVGGLKKSKWRVNCPSSIKNPASHRRCSEQEQHHLIIDIREQQERLQQQLQLASTPKIC
jgi:hypothetical protein